jgi:hypothetical protein
MMQCERKVLATVSPRLVRPVAPASQTERVCLKTSTAGPVRRAHSAILSAPMKLSSAAS